MKIELLDISQLGEIVRQERKAQKVTQIQLAQLANVGIRFVRDIENGKISVHSGKLMQVLNTLGIAISLNTPSGE